MIEYYYGNHYDSIKLYALKYAIIYKNGKCLMESDKCNSAGRNCFKHFKIEKERFLEFVKHLSTIKRDTFLVDCISGRPFVKFICHSNNNSILVSIVPGNNPFFFFKEHLDSLFESGKTLRNSNLVVIERNKVVKQMCSKDFPEPVIFYPRFFHENVLKKPDFILSDTLFH